MNVLDDIVCVHGLDTGTCDVCARGSTRSHAPSPGSRTGFEKLLVFCPTISTETLLHFNRQGDSYRLRSFVGELRGRTPWMQPDAPTSLEFLRLYRPEHTVDVEGERLSLERADRWEAIVTHHNRRLGIPR